MRLRGSDISSSVDATPNERRFSQVRTQHDQNGNPNFPEAALSRSASSNESEKGDDSLRDSVNSSNDDHETQQVGRDADEPPVSGDSRAVNIGENIVDDGVLDDVRQNVLDQSVKAHPAAGDEEHFGGGSEDISDDGVIEPDASVKLPTSHLGKRKRKGNKGPKILRPINASRDVTPALGNGEVQNNTSGGGSPSPEKNGAGATLKRLPGRRRAPHADVQIEAKLRRQLELKVAYRAVAKAQKLILAELARRTAEELESNAEAHKDYEEYEEITEELGFRLKDRLRILQSSFNDEEARLERMVTAQEHFIKEKYKQKVVDSCDNRILQAQHDFLTTIRSAVRNDDSEATEDEDGIIPRLYSAQPPSYERRALSDTYDSRSRFYVRTQLLWDECEMRCKLRDLQRAYDVTSVISKPKKFATFDWAHRDMANTAWNIDMLVDAVKDVDEVAAKNDIDRRDEAVAGLQALAMAFHAVPVKVQEQTPKHPFKREQSSQIRDTLLDHSQLNPLAQMLPSHRPPPADETDRRTSDVHMLSNGEQFAPMQQPGLPPVMAAGTRVEAPTNEPQHVIHAVGNALLWNGPIAQPRFPEPLGQRFFEQPRPVDTQIREAPGQPLGQPLEFVQVTQPAPPPSQPPVQPAVPPPNALSAPPSKPRNRPGPKAVYATPGVYGVPTMQKHWSPFTNSMGPPMYLPKYMQDAELQRRPSISNGTFPPPMQGPDPMYQMQQIPPPPPFDPNTSSNPLHHSHHRKHSSGRSAGFQNIAPAWSQQGEMPRNSLMQQQQQSQCPPQLQQQQQPPHGFQPDHYPQQDMRPREQDPFRSNFNQGPPAMHPPPVYHQQRPPGQPYFQQHSHPYPFQDVYPPQQPMGYGQDPPHFTNHGLPPPMLPQSYGPQGYPRHSSPRQSFVPNQPLNGPLGPPAAQQHAGQRRHSSLTDSAQQFAQAPPGPTDVLQATSNQHRRGSYSSTKAQATQQPERTQQRQSYPGMHHQHPGQSFLPSTSLRPLPPHPQSRPAPQQRTHRAFSSSKPSIASLLHSPPTVTKAIPVQGASGQAPVGQRPPS